MPRRATEKLFLTALGRRIREARERGGFTQEALATELRVEPETISRLEHGRMGPSLALLLEISSAVNVPLPALVDVAPISKSQPTGDSLEILALCQRMPPERQALALRVLREMARE